jgi:hypothetical protein
MQWLVHAPPAVVDALTRHEHKTHAPSELGSEDILAAAHAKQWDIITTDAALAMLPFESRQRFGRCIVYLQSPDGDLSDAVDRLFARYPRLSPGRLYTVTASRVKVRQLPTTRSGI